MLRGSVRSTLRHRVIPIAVALLVTALAGCGGGTPTSQSAQDHTSAAAPATSPLSGPVSHIAVIVLENKEYDQVIGRPGAPYLNALARQSALATNYYAITHPSLPNYLALTGGSTAGFSGSDCGTCSVSRRNLVDQLQAAGVSWKVYAQSMPSVCSTRVTAGEYVRRHNPFLYYRDVAANPRRCQFIVPATALDHDLAAHTLPRLVWLIPNICDDMHSCDTYTGDRYLRGVVPRLIAGLGPSGVLFITFDEGSTNLGCCAVAKGGRIVTIVAGPGARPGARSSTPYDHYSLLRTIEDLLGLPRLGGAALPATRPMTALLRVRPLR
jgi:phosphatidylinositol-3-phosphatase